MSDKRVPASTGDQAKADRLAAALRANLKRRKAQARAKDEDLPSPPLEPRTEAGAGTSDIKKP
ncbi:MAG: hypothetical protein JNL06_11640 [Alphaproteobacteria bacterium]|nr:hypothetical protein [Alphaproteobacteria bacterium]